MAKLIMTVDDSTSVRQMVAFTLKNAGYDVIEATDGKDALAKGGWRRREYGADRFEHAEYGRHRADTKSSDKPFPSVHSHRHADHGVAGFKETGRQKSRCHRFGS